MRKLLSFLISALCLAAFSRPAAAADFSDNYNVTYTVDENGLTQVNQEISIVNNTKDTYASDYTLTIGSGQIDNVTAKDRLGMIPVEIVKQNGQTLIHVTFNDKVVGNKRALNWNLNYATSDIAFHHGTVWEIIIPRLSVQKEIGDYNVQIKLPQSFGPVLYLSPTKYSEEDNQNYYLLKYAKEEFAKTGIVLAFGSAQRYGLELTYHLKSPSFFSSEVEVALPPDVFGEQYVTVESLLPPPLAVRVDADGNYLAKYMLKAHEEKTLSLKARVFVVHKTPDLKQSGKISETAENLRQLYTQPGPYWESTDPEIKTLAASLTDQNQNAAENARNLYEYVTSHLSYDWESVRLGKPLERKGAKRALAENKSAVCMEYADLFIALLRASGIPARRLTGYAFSENTVSQPVTDDALHTWVQLYLPKIGWISTDPTWGSTTNGLDYFSKLDTNHVTFAINGQNSETPYPAGAYKLSAAQKGDIKVSFLEDPSYYPAPPALNSELKAGVLTIANHALAQGAALDLAARITLGGKEKEYYLGTLPSFAATNLQLPVKDRETIDVELISKNYDGTLSNRDYTLTNQGQVSLLNSLLMFNPYLPLALMLGLCTIVLLVITFRVVRRK